MKKYSNLFDDQNSGFIQAERYEFHLKDNLHLRGIHVNKASTFWNVTKKFRHVLAFYKDF